MELSTRRISSNNQGVGSSDALDDVIASLADPPGYLYKYITIAANYACKTGAGVLGGISINKTVATAVTTVYDGTDATGALMGIITQSAVTVPGVVMQNIEFNDGLFIVHSVATADLTAAYR